MFKKIARKTLVVFLTVLVFFFSNITPMLKQVAMSAPTIPVGTDLLGGGQLPVQQGYSPSLEPPLPPITEESIAVEKCQGCFGNMPKPLTF